MNDNFPTEKKIQELKETAARQLSVALSTLEKLNNGVYLLNHQSDHAIYATRWIHKARALTEAAADQLGILIRWEQKEYDEPGAPDP